MFFVLHNTQFGTLLFLKEECRRRGDYHEEAIAAEIYDAVGRVVYKGDLRFATKQSELLLPDSAPGLYLLRLRDSKGRIFTFKFEVR